jgi:hypothetical protein
VAYLHYAHAIGMERLALLMEELFSLSISEGAISNILARARVRWRCRSREPWRQQSGLSLGVNIPRGSRFPRITCA